MRLSPRKPEEPDVNLTPMIDVVFLLLLFFMVSTSFIRESSLKVDLPEATGQQLVEEQPPIDIVINAEGHFIINETLLLEPDNTRLESMIKQAVGDRKDPHIIISADAITDYQHIVSAMDVVQQMGYTRLTLATRQKTSK